GGAGRGRAVSTVWDDPPPRPGPVAARVRAGVLAGLLAGTVTAVAAFAESAGLGLGFWTPAKAVAAAATGLPALVGDGATVSAGLGLHAALSALYGLLLGLVLPRRGGVGAALVTGVAWGAVLWLVGTWVLLPIFNEVQLDRVRLVPWSWLAAHLVFGGM